MMDEHSAAILRDVLRRQQRSLLQYVSEAYPWTTPERRDLLGRLQGLIDEERAEAAALARLLATRHVAPPYLGSYPADFTTINYVALDHLAPLLVREQQRAVARLERDLSGLTDAEAREALRRLLESKQRHLKVLEGLAGAAAPASKGGVPAVG